MSYLKKILFLLFIGSWISGYSTVYVLGYPRSGTHLFTFSLSRVLNKYVIADPNTIYQAVRMSPGNEELVKEKYNEETKKIPVGSILFSHSPELMQLDLANPNEDFLIVLLRDYHECMARHFGPENPDLINILKKQCAEAKHRTKHEKFCYPLILDHYEKWNKKTRILIYYEALISDFENVMTNCLEKLGITQHTLPQFMEHYDERMKESAKIYEVWGCVSGNNPKYYQENYLSKKSAREMDEILMNNFPNHWEKYLKHYSVKLSEKK